MRARSVRYYMYRVLLQYPGEKAKLEKKSEGFIRPDIAASVRCSLRPSTRESIVP